MAFAFITSLVTLVCQGCVSAGSTNTAYAEPATEPSLGMALAVPGGFGDGALNAPTGTTLSGPPVAPPRAATAIRLTGPDAAVSVLLQEPPPAPFALTGSGVSGPAQVGNGLTWTETPLLGAVAAEIATSTYGQPSPEYRDVSIGLSVAASSVETGLAFDVGLAPRIGIREGGELSGRSLGGEVRFGQGLNVLDAKGQPEGWYVFVGADGEALVWDADRDRLGMDSLDDMQITDQLTVGDLQAGVSIQRAGGELSFSYIRREIEFSDRNRSLEDTEDFAGITFTMRR